MSSHEKQLEERVYYLLAKQSHFRNVAVTYLGEKRVEEIEKNSEPVIRRLKERLMLEPIPLKQQAG